MSTEPQSQETPGGSEFEREPVPQNRWLGFRSFVGMYAGEHTAGTELMIGPLFVAAGVSAFDVVVGLLVGDLLAVLSWVFLCAPIATRARLTLYYQLEKICGRKLVTLYDLANGVMFCFLAGAMVTVSATALGVWFHFDMPALKRPLPQQPRLGPRGLGIRRNDRRRGRVRVRDRGQGRRSRLAVDGAGIHRVWTDRLPAVH